MNRRKRQDAHAAALDMKKFILPFMTLLVLGQTVYLFTAFDVAGAVGEVLERLHTTLQTKLN